MIIPDIYINAGGVTVSYFEWLKNLSHVRFGRMQKRNDEEQFSKLANLVQSMTGKKISKGDYEKVVKGADEIDLVNSGLEETMINATHEIMNAWKSNPDIPDMRTAAYVVAINKVGTSYAELGIFP